MTEEKKENPQEEKGVPVKPEPKAEAPVKAAPEAKAEAPAAPQPAAAEPQAAPAAVPVKEEKKAEAPAKVKPENCAGCKKSIKKKRWYYRNGKFYCTKRCWMTANKKEAKPAEAAGAEAK
jgi:hypothetical protein